MDDERVTWGHLIAWRAGPDPMAFSSGRQSPHGSDLGRIATVEPAHKNIAIKVIDELFLVAYGTVNPTDPEWTSYLELVQHHGVVGTVQLISTDGGEPSSTQRNKLNALLGGRHVPVAVLTDVPRVRRTVRWLSWFNRRIQHFPKDGLRDALHYLEIPPLREGMIAEELGWLRREVRAASDERPTRGASR